MARKENETKHEFYQRLWHDLHGGEDPREILLELLEYLMLEGDTEP